MLFVRLWRQDWQLPTSPGMKKKKLHSVNINGHSLPYCLSLRLQIFCCAAGKCTCSSPLHSLKQKLLFYANDRNFNIESPPSDLLSAHGGTLCNSLWRNGRLWRRPLLVLPHPFITITSQTGGRGIVFLNNCSTAVFHTFTVGYLAC